MRPRALVARFLLDPPHLLRGPVPLEERTDLREGERAELLDAHERDAAGGRGVERGAGFEEVVVELAGEEDDAGDGGGGGGG